MVGVNCYKKMMCKENCEHFNSCNCRKEFERKENKKIKLDELVCKNYKRNEKEI